MFHPGIALAQHQSKNPSPYLSHPKPNEFCICGGSGGKIWEYSTQENIQLSSKTINCEETCGFQTGIPCEGLKLYRKWSCCEKQIFGTIQDLYQIRGCQSFCESQKNYHLNIGDKVRTKSFAVYDNNVPIGTIGTIVHIRERYTNTPNEYKQYRLSFDNYLHLNNNQTNNLYTDNNIEKYN